MATIQDNTTRTRDKTNMWVIGAIIATLVIGYAVYQSYDNDDTAGVTGMVNNNVTTPATPAP